MAKTAPAKVQPQIAKPVKAAKAETAKPANLPSKAAAPATPKEKKEKKSHKALLTTRLGRALKRIVQAKSFLRGSEIADEADAAEASLRALAIAVQELPEDWTRAKGGRKARQTFEEGQLVAVTKAWRATYEELMEDAEMDELRVVKKAEMKNGNAVYSVVTADGTRLFIAAAHLSAAE